MRPLGKRFLKWMRKIAFVFVLITKGWNRHWNNNFVCSGHRLIKQEHLSAGHFNSLAVKKKRKNQKIVNNDNCRPIFRGLNNVPRRKKTETLLKRYSDFQEVKYPLFESRNFNRFSIHYLNIEDIFTSCIIYSHHISHVKNIGRLF